MDSMIAAAGRALAAGDVLGALQCVALRDDPSALALRGIAMARLGELPRARDLLRRAARGFGAHEELARARCLVAEAETALAMRDLRGSPRVLDSATATLDACGDRANAVHARLLAARRLLLLGRLDAATSALAALEASGAPPALATVHGLTVAELAMRSLRTTDAREALARAHAAAERSGAPALLAEVTEARAVLERPAARRVAADGEQLLRLDDVAALHASGALLVDACRHGIRCGDDWRPLARRPVLFALARALAEAWPGDVARDALIARAFRTRRPDDSHRARLRVEIGRLRSQLVRLASVAATARGFELRPQAADAVTVLAPPFEGDADALLALLADGAAWSTSALALALGASQRSVQRALAELESAGRVRSMGRARLRRWLTAPLAGCTTILLLPAAVSLK